ncbi:hypothetical protein Q5P01_011645 [Channa striata]|uniref:Uncharacterized protein n=1 Tax=Channa striata TaxID=64152 RepID=A0AA88MTN8_CHASR|nr:hypothetical protein Q5P01_011645 [Channa striata]
MSPTLCRIRAVLCSSPVGCTVDKGLLQTSVTAALGTIEILVGLFNVALGTGRTSIRPGDLTDLRAAYWLGAVYTAAGVMAVFAGRLPSLCLVGFAVLMNIVGSIFAVVGTVLYAIDLGDASVASMCSWKPLAADNSDDKCVHVALIAQRLLTGMDIILIILAVLQLCVCISFAVLGIRAMVSRQKDEFGADVHIYQPAFKEVLTNSRGA